MKGKGERQRVGHQIAGEKWHRVGKREIEKR